MHPISVFITDDHPLAVTGLENMLLPYSQIKITGKFYSAGHLLDGLKEAQPDVLLLDILMPDKTGKEIVPEILDLYPLIKIIAVTSLDAPTHVKAMMRSGCAAYLLKYTNQEQLVEVIEKVHRGETFVEPSLQAKMMDNMLAYKKKQQKERSTQPKVPQLTRREKEILELLAKDYTNQEIADTLFLSIRTVECHRLNLLRKLDAKTPMGLLVTAIEMKLI